MTNQAQKSFLKWGLISAIPLAFLAQIPFMMADNAREVAEVVEPPAPIASVEVEAPKTEKVLNFKTVEDMELALMTTGTGRVIEEKLVEIAMANGLSASEAVAVVRQASANLGKPSNLPGLPTQEVAAAPEPVVEPDPEPTMSMGAALSEMCAAAREYRQFGASKSQALVEIRSYATFMMEENNFGMSDRTALIVHGRDCAGV